MKSILSAVGLVLLSVFVIYGCANTQSDKNTSYKSQGVKNVIWERFPVIAGNGDKVTVKIAWGLMSFKSMKTFADERSASGVIQKTKGLHVVETTTKIPLKMGTTFGIFVIAEDNLKNTPLLVKVIWEFTGNKKLKPFVYEKVHKNLREGFMHNFNKNEPEYNYRGRVIQSVFIDNQMIKTVDFEIY